MHALVEQAVVAAGSSDGRTLAAMAVIALPIMAYVLLVLGALISIVGSPQDLGMKLVWVVFVFIAPFIGSLLWFLFGRGSARRTAAYGGR